MKVKSNSIGERVSAPNGSGANGHPQIKEINQKSKSHIFDGNQFKRKNPQDLWLGKEFLDLTLKTHKKEKTNKPDSIKI